MHSEVSYLSQREADADQILCQSLSRELDNRSLGSCIVWVHLIIHWFAHQSCKDWWSAQISMYPI